MTPPADGTAEEGREMLLLHRKDTAGASAEARYKTARSNWRRRHYRPVGLILAGACAVLIAAKVVLGGSSVDWLLGAALGSAFTLWLCSREFFPAYIDNWRIGAEGERRTARAIRRLERQGWHAVHDRTAKYGNFDHLIAGPSGVFLIDSKQPGGRVSVDGEVMVVDRIDDPDGQYRLPRLAPAMRARAAELKRTLDSGGVKPGWVSAVVVVWAEFPERVQDADRVTFVHGDELAGWLERQPARIGAAGVERVWSALAALPEAG